MNSYKKIEEERIFPNLFYEAYITMIPKSKTLQE